MTCDISPRMKCCHTFAISKSAAYIKVGFLCSPTPVCPMEKIHIDFKGKLPRTTKGNTMVAIDQFSKFTLLTPLWDATTSSTIQTLKSIFQHFGFLKTIISNNATYFTSEKSRHYCFCTGSNMQPCSHINLNPPTQNVSTKTYVSLNCLSFPQLKYLAPIFAMVAASIQLCSARDNKKIPLLTYYLTLLQLFHWC